MRLVLPFARSLDREVQPKIGLFPRLPWPSLSHRHAITVALELLPVVPEGKYYECGET